jgi:hypothetical protein
LRLQNEVDRDDLFLVLRSRTDSLAMHLSHCGTLSRARIKPMQYQGLNDPFGIGQVLRAVIFKSSEGLVVEAIRPLDGLGLRVWFRCTAG